MPALIGRYLLEERSALKALSLRGDGFLEAIRICVSMARGEAVHDTSLSSQIAVVEVLGGHTKALGSRDGEVVAPAGEQETLRVDGSELCS